MNSWLNDVLDNDPDPTESREWLESLKAVIDADGPARAHQLLKRRNMLAHHDGGHVQRAGGGAETAGVHHAHKDFHTAHLVHRLLIVG